MMMNFGHECCLFTFYYAIKLIVYEMTKIIPTTYDNMTFKRENISKFPPPYIPT